MMKTMRVACLLGVMAWVAPASADDIIWDGGGADNNWDTAENWSNDVVPTFFENVFFTSASSKDCVVTQNQVVFDFTITAGYTGTLSIFNGPILTVSGDMSVEGGTINIAVLGRLTGAEVDTNEIDERRLSLLSLHGFEPGTSHGVRGTACRASAAAPQAWWTLDPWRRTCRTREMKRRMP